MESRCHTDTVPLCHNCAIVCHRDGTAAESERISLPAGTDDTKTPRFRRTGECNNLRLPSAGIPPYGRFSPGRLPRFGPRRVRSAYFTGSEHCSSCRVRNASARSKSAVGRFSAFAFSRSARTCTSDFRKSSASSPTVFFASSEPGSSLRSSLRSVSNSIPSSSVNRIASNRRRSCRISAGARRASGAGAIRSCCPARSPRSNSLSWRSTSLSRCFNAAFARSNAFSARSTSNFSRASTSAPTQVSRCSHAESVAPS